MARPRVFIGSTFYDLKQVRADLERFIREIGYEPVLNERGSIAYGSDEKLEEYCYKEIELSDMLVTIVGGRYGTGAQQQPYSISQMELKKALEFGKQVYIFVERSVNSEYSTYLVNKDNPDVQYGFVDNPKVYKFLEEIESLPSNNPTAPFETSKDIIDYLKEQWAGLFQRSLQEQARQKEVRSLEGIQATAQTLNQLVTFLTEERRDQDQAIKDILLSNHPAFQQLATLTGAGYRVFFTNHDELAKWLNARNYSPINKQSWDEPQYEEWGRETKGDLLLLKIHTSIFEENGKLKVYTSEEWNKDWIKKETHRSPPEEETEPPPGDDIPF